jgi:thiamine-phosphate pyrophosphorylase
MRRHCITEGDRPIPASATVVQLRAKHLSGRELLERARRLRESLTVPLMINTRADVCIAAGARGIHLPGGHWPPWRYKKRFGEHLWIGVSCHSLEEVRRAEQEAADYVYLSPIFASPGKPGYGPLLGLEALAEAAASIQIPVVALGGVTPNNERACIEAGAAGIAGISYFTAAES